jgi:nitroimidazol reductase NimA-like FMN-containing flavoprotein (pyridoxamine 5'-phosphate oxidase superfamily)
MSFHERWFQGQLHELEEDECSELMASRPVGRVAYVDDRGPVAVPVTYVTDGRTLVFRVAAYSTVGRHLPTQAAALEVDEIDEYTRSGWSVVVRGLATTMEPDELPDDDSGPRPWAAGQRTLYIRLVPTEVTGRRLLAA